MHLPQGSFWDLTEKLIAWIRTSTRRESRHYLSAHPELLSDEAEKILIRLVQVQKSDNPQRILEDYCVLLHRCREVGVIRAFAETTPFPPSPASAFDLPLVLELFLQAETEEQAQYLLDKYPVLLSEEADALLSQWSEAGSDQRNQQIFEEIRLFLSYCRKVGVAKALAEDVSDERARILSVLTPTFSEFDQLPQRLTDLPRYIQHTKQALTQFDKNDAPEPWATLHNNLGVAYSLNPHARQLDNLEYAIYHYHQALTVRTRESAPIDWAETQNNLGNAFCMRIKGERIDNLEQAIYHYRQALEVYSRQAFPESWAMVQNNLGEAYRNRIAGTRATNLEKAINHCRQALEVRTRQAIPVDWAETQIASANAFLLRVFGKQSDNLEQAIFHYKQALTTYTRRDFPEKWALIQNNLGFAYLKRIVGRRVDNLEQALSHLQQALEVRTRQNAPADWAQTQNNLGSAYWVRIIGKQADNLEKSLFHCQQALTVFTRQNLPESWAMTQSNLAKIFFSRIAGDPADNVEQAITHCQQALQVYTAQHYPDYWANLQLELANIFLGRIDGRRRRNLEQAIFFCQQALKVYTRADFPQNWAQAQHTLAQIFFLRIEGKHSYNLEQAIQYAERALEIYIRADFPENWAFIQYDLGNIYRNRIAGERAENIEQAIKHLKQALEIYTEQDFPQDWALVCHSLAQAFIFRVTGDRLKNLERAHFYCRQGLKIHTRQDFPQNWASIQHNLANIFLYRLDGKSITNLERAIFHCRQALQIYNRQGFPERWALIQNTLADVFIFRITGDRSDNLEKAIFYSKQALQVYTLENFPQNWALVQITLGSAYYKRINGGREDNLEQAIFHYEQALTVYTKQENSERWAQIQNNLGEAYRNRIKGDREVNLQQAIFYLEQALTVYTRQSFPERWALTLSNLAVVLLNCTAGHRANNIERSIFHLKQALAICTHQVSPEYWALIQTNLGEAYHNRIGGDKASNLKQAIYHYEQALEVFDPHLFYDPCRRTARNLGNLYFEEHLWSEAVIPYRQALQAAENLYKVSLLRGSKEQELAEMADICHRAAYAMARVGRLQEAVETLEQGRARSLGEALAYDHSNLERIKIEDPEVYELYQQAVINLRRLEAQQRESGLLDSVTGMPLPSYEVVSNQIHQAQNNLNLAVERIRRISGYEDFLSQPDYRDIARTVEIGIPLVYLATTSAGCLALILYRNNTTSKTTKVSIEVIWAGEITNDNIVALLVKQKGSKIVGGYLSELYLPRQLKKSPDRAILEVRMALESALKKALSVLGKKLIGPIATRLRELKASGVILIAGGHLGLLPLHAAQYEIDGHVIYFIDEFEVGYIPTVRIMLLTNQNHVKSKYRLLALGNPTMNPPSPAWFTDLLAQEIMREMKDGLLLLHEAATLRALQSAVLAGPPTHLLLGCHGVFEMMEPLQSGLDLADGRLTLSQLLNDFRLFGTKLVTLCACQTALYRFHGLTDEVVGLPAGFLQAGAQAVLATLWLVDALPTVLLLRYFYRQIVQGIAPIQALRLAIIWLRDLSQDEYRTEVTQLRQQASSNVISELDELVNKHYLSTQPFASPIYWAAFTYNGVPFGRSAAKER